jgi:hypothetical protein
MTSLNACVQEFIDHHSSTLFPSDNTNARRPRINRFNSITSPPSVDIEDEDPSSLEIIFPSKK